MERQQNEIQNHQRMENQMNLLIDQGLVKQDIVGGWVAVDSLEEQQAVLQRRAAEAQRVQQLEQQVNQNPPPQIGADRQRAGQ